MTPTAGRIRSSIAQRVDVKKSALVAVRVKKNHLRNERAANGR
jgi:hypothetical protein